MPNYPHEISEHYPHSTPLSLRSNSVDREDVTSEYKYLDPFKRDLIGGDTTALNSVKDNPNNWVVIACISTEAEAKFFGNYHKSQPQDRVVMVKKDKKGRSKRSRESAPTEMDPISRTLSGNWESTLLRRRHHTFDESFSLNQLVTLELCEKAQADVITVLENYHDELTLEVKYYTGTVVYDRVFDMQTGRGGDPVNLTKPHGKKHPKDPKQEITAYVRRDKQQKFDFKTYTHHDKFKSLLVCWKTHLGNKSKAYGELICHVPNDDAGQGVAHVTENIGHNGVTILGMIGDTNLSAVDVSHYPSWQGYSRSIHGRTFAIVPSSSAKKFTTFMRRISFFKPQPGKEYAYFRASTLSLLLTKEYSDCCEIPDKKDHPSIMGMTLMKNKLIDF